MKHQSVSYVRLNVEDIVSKEYTIQLRTEGTPAEGYVVVAQDAYAVMEPSVVILSGPQSQIDRIASAEAVLDVQDASDTVSGKGKAITFLDTDGNPVLLDELEDISYSAKVMMQLSVPVYFVQEVPIRTVEITEDPNNEYYVDSSSLSQESVQLYGPKNVLAGITEIELAAVSAADKTATFQQSYDLTAICTKDVSGIRSAYRTRRRQCVADDSDSQYEEKRDPKFQRYRAELYLAELRQRQDLYLGGQQRYRPDTGEAFSAGQPDIGQYSLYGRCRGIDRKRNV